MASNKHTLPHTSSGNGYHLDISSDREGHVAPEKLHVPLDKPKAEHGTLEALRQRLAVDKGY